MIRTPIATLAILCILAGAALLIGPVFGFTTIAADRGVTVDIADAPDKAYLGVVDRTAEEPIGITDGESETVFYLNDSTGGFDSVALSSVAFEDSHTGLDVSLEDDGESEHDYAVQVSCGDSVQEMDGRLTVGLIGSGSVTVEHEATTTTEISLNCRWSGGGDGFVHYSVSDVTGSSQEFVFEVDGFLGPDGAVEIEIDTWGDIDYSDAIVTGVSGETSSDTGDASFVDDRTIAYEPDGPSEGEVTIEVEGMEVGESWAGGQGIFTRTDTGVSKWSDNFEVGQ